MRRIIRSLALLALAGLLIAASAGPAFAKTTRIPVVGTGTVVQPLSPGVTTLVGSVLSVRGASQLMNYNSASPFVAGAEVVVVSYDIDLATGAGELWGTATKSPTAYPEGAWYCEWHGTFGPPVWTGKGWCHGTGTLTGWQWRAQLTAWPASTVSSGYVFLPGN